MKKNGLPRDILIKSKSEIRDVLKNGLQKIGEAVTIYEVPKAKNEKARFAFLCNRNIKKATERNRLKRILREIVRTNRIHIQNYKIIFLVREPARDKTFWQIKEDFVRLISGTPQ